MFCILISIKKLSCEVVFICFLIEFHIKPCLIYVTKAFLKKFKFFYFFIYFKLIFFFNFFILFLYDNIKNNF